MKRQSAVSIRPKRFSQLIGQDKVVTAIRNFYKKQDISAWMFVGGTGLGKTTIARILALSLQCTHSELGEPCKECQEEATDFNIEEINASETSGVEKIGAIAEVSNYAPSAGLRRVFILDEAQRLSRDSQNLLLKYFEEAPKSTVWMICTTERHKIRETLQRRCKTLELKKLLKDDIEKLVSRGYRLLLGKEEKGPPMDALVEAICEVKIQSPGLILNAVDNYLVGQMTAEESVKYLSQESDTKALCISITKGDWVQVKKEIKDATADDLRGIRAGMAGYLQGMLEETYRGPRGDEVARAIERVARVDSYSDVTQGPATVGVLYQLCQLFSGPESGVETEGVEDD